MLTGVLILKQFQNQSQAKTNKYTQTKLKPDYNQTNLSVSSIRLSSILFSRGQICWDRCRLHCLWKHKSQKGFWSKAPEKHQTITGNPKSGFLVAQKIYSCPWACLKPGLSHWIWLQPEARTKNNYPLKEDDLSIAKGFSKKNKKIIKHPKRKEVGEV